jgi:hypothetical protein
MVCVEADCKGQLRALTATGVMGRTRYITGVSGGAPLIELGRVALRRTLGACNDVSLCRMMGYASLRVRAEHRRRDPTGSHLAT